MSEEIDTANSQLVGVDGSGNVSVMFPKAVMTRDEALRHAAWLAVVADPAGDDFAAVQRAILAT